MIRAMPVDELSQALLPVLCGAGYQATPEKLKLITPLIRERIRLLNDAVAAADFFFVHELPPYDPAELIPQKGDAGMAQRALDRALEVLPSMEFSHDALEAGLRAASKELGIKAGQMFQPIRVAVCGRKTAPPLFGTLEALGKETTLERIGLGIEKLRSL
jgi:glutamyl-tRNA synthetase